MIRDIYNRLWHWWFYFRREIRHWWWRMTAVGFFPHVNTYETWQKYGGPEEGGWWYNCGSPLYGRRVFVLFAYWWAERQRIYLRGLPDGEQPRYYFVLGTDTPDWWGTEYCVMVERYEGEAYPTERQYYC